MLISLFTELSFPLTNPVLKFLVILLIILIIPIVLNRIRIPAILGLILAGAVIGPHGINLLERDSGIILSGTAGLLYIMFLAGLEIDPGDFKRNRIKSLLFGLYTFCIPMFLGLFGGIYLLDYNVETSVLLASMFASHTLIAYPIVRRMGIIRNIAVNISVGGTIITDTLALLVLAVIVGMNRGEADLFFWIRLGILVLIFGFIVLFIFPLISRWFFKNFNDPVGQYIFVLSLVFLAAFLAELAGIEGIIGAFLCGLALNPFIPRNSVLMSRVEFVGNAIFIPFFLIGIGMLINYSLFFSDAGSLKVGLVMIVIATLGKYLAAKLAQKTFRLTSSEGLMIFGLSNAQAAATLAAVLIGYNIITGYTISGEPIRLLSDEVLNGTILMILVTCTMASFAAEKAGRGILSEKAGEKFQSTTESNQRILIALKNTENVDFLINLASFIKLLPVDKTLYALNVITSPQNKAEAESILIQAENAAAGQDKELKTIVRYDFNLENAISWTLIENEISDLIIGMHNRSSAGDSYLGAVTEGLLGNCKVNLFIYKPLHQLNTIKRHLVVIPENAEAEQGFYSLLSRVWSLVQNTGSKVLFFAFPSCIKLIRSINARNTLKAKYHELNVSFHLDSFLKDTRENDNLIFFMDQKGARGYSAYMENLPAMLKQKVNKNSWLLLYSNLKKDNNDFLNLVNASLEEPVEKLEGMVRGLFGRK